LFKLIRISKNGTEENDNAYTSFDTGAGTSTRTDHNENIGSATTISVSQNHRNAVQ